MTQQAVTRQLCGACGGELLPLLDENGAISVDFLTARGSCCTNGCRNCPYDKTETAGSQPNVGMAEKICPRCAGIFQCHSSACWCANVQLSAAALKWLERQYDNCLCPSCLGSFSSC